MNGVIILIDAILVLYIKFNHYFDKNIYFLFVNKHLNIYLYLQQLRNHLNEAHSKHVNIWIF